MNANRYGVPYESLPAACAGKLQIADGQFVFGVDDRFTMGVLHHKLELSPGIEQSKAVLASRGARLFPPILVRNMDDIFRVNDVRIGPFLFEPGVERMVVDGAVIPKPVVFGDSGKALALRNRV